MGLDSCCRAAVTWIEVLEADGSWVPKYLVIEPLYVSFSADETMEVRY